MATQTPNARAEARRKEKEAQRRAESQRQRLIYGGVGLVVLLIIVVVAVVTVGETDDRVRLSEIAGSPQIEGDALPPIPEGGEDPALGMSAPVIEGADFDGNPITVGDGAQVVSFVASWCPACDAELPEVVAWQEAGGPPEGVDLVLVSTNMDDSRQNWPPQEWLANAGYTGEVLVDDVNSSSFQTYGLQATPSWVVISEEGEVVFRASGMIDPEQFDQLGQLAATG